MNYPGGHDARMPESWPRDGSGYRLAGPQLQRDPVRGFPPTPGARDPEYPPSYAQAWDGAHLGGETRALAPDRPVAGMDFLAAGRNGRDVAARESDPDQEAWRSDWSGGPWGAAWGAGPWGPQAAQVAEIGNGHGLGAFAGSVNGSHMWTYGEDDPTEIWTLRGNTDAQRVTSGDEGNGAIAAEKGNTRASSGTAAGVRARQRSARQVRTRRSSGRPRVLLMSTAATVAVIALAAAGGYALTTKHKTAGTPSTASATPSQPPLATPTPPADLGPWQYITNQVVDPLPLTLAELFPAQAAAGARSYQLTAERAGRSCRSAVFGSRLKAAVRKGCSQALRASYLSSSGKSMGTIGVLNLTTAGTAAKIGKVATASGQFIQPLPAAYGASKNLGKGTGVVWAVTKGHYLILMWAQYTNLHSPTTSRDRQLLLQFVNDLYQKTVNLSLTRRMVTGKPLTP
jgi:hypothetical protein